MKYQGSLVIPCLLSSLSRKCGEKVNTEAILVAARLAVAFRINNK